MKLLAEILTILAGLTATYAGILWLMRRNDWRPDKNQTIVTVIKAACAVALAAGSYVATSQNNPQASSPLDHQIGH